MIASATTSRADELRAYMQAKGVPEAKIQAALEAGGYASRPSPGMGHYLGLAGRGVVQGAGDIADLMPMGMPQKIGNQLAGIPSVPTGASSADALGLPQPQTPGERIGTSAAEGAAMAVPFALAGPAGAASALGTMATGAASNAAGQGAAESGYGPLGQAIASTIVGGGVPLLHYAGSGFVRAALAGASAARSASREALAWFQSGNPDAAVSLGQVARGGMGRTLQGGMRNLPGSSEILKASSERQASEMGARVEDVANRLSPGASKTAAGATLQRGIRETWVPNGQATSRALYGVAEQLVPPETPTMLPHAIALFGEQSQLVADAKPLAGDFLASPQMQAWGQQFEQALAEHPTGLPFKTVSAFRSMIGGMMSGEQVPEGMKFRDLKRLWGALSEDMASTVQQKGGTEGMTAWTQATKHWDHFTDQMENVIQPIMDKGTPEKAFNALMAGSRDGATIINTAMKGLEPAQRAVVQSAVLRNLGMHGETFSPEVYLQNIGKIDKSAWSALMAGADPALSNDLQTLSKAMKARKAAAAVLPNPSGTASNVAFLSVLAGIPTLAYGAFSGNAALMASSAGPLASVGAANLVARAFTSPRIVSWMVKQTKVPARMLAQQLAILAKDAQQWEPADRDTALELVHGLTGLDWNKILLAHAAAGASSAGRGSP